ncbi:hypothetical protein DLM45_03460 [Hyphomicrobium methylovorum]|uniref:SMP-30/gluconolactonase/LRE family protein n=1 Tax=Hyphomicrobium methylovorum TaxID=84 RepID=UPI0015E77172|nr:SMP-30/gluconolactonase/LRE family protein [Hyphomicrobium methylovorum]MBA2125280.1 hypothetical protein [Hyphomicrobium methylovorum]
MTIQMRLAQAAALTLAGVISIASPVSANDMNAIAVAGDRAYPESIAAASDGTLYVSSLASGGIFRIKPGASTSEEWIKPGAFDTRSTFGVLVNDKTGELLVCSNDASGIGVPGPSEVKGSHLKAFDLASGEGKWSVKLPKDGSICNDAAIANDGSIYVTNTSSPQILKLKPGAKEFEVWLESEEFNQPKEGAGLDGIAIGTDGNLYLNTYTNAELYRVEVKDGSPGKITKLKPSRALQFADGLRPVDGENTFIMAEGSGSIDRVTIKGDTAEIETIKDGFSGPTSVALVNGAYYVTEGQLPHLFDPKAGPPKLPFQVTKVPAKN